MIRALNSRAALLFALAGEGLDFLRAACTAASSGALSLSFTSADEGALAVVFAQSTTTVPAITASAGGWTTTDPGIWGTYERRIFSKVITAGDVASGLTLGSISTAPGGEGGVLVWIGRGPASLSVLSNTTSGSGDTTLVVPAHTPVATSLGVIAFVLDVDNPPVAGFSPPAAPAGLTRQAAVVAGGFAYGLFEWPGASDTGQALTFTGFDASSAQSGVLLELL